MKKDQVTDDEIIEIDEPHFAGEPPVLTLSIAQWLSRELLDPDFLLGGLLSTTSRGVLVGTTGLGKTNFLMQLAFSMAEGTGFLHWQGHRKCKVLYVDGEMSRRLLKKRVADLVKRNGYESETLFILSHEDIDGFQPLNTPEGVACLNAVIERIGGVDFVILDSVMCLTQGDMKEEEGWAQTMPLVRDLTRRNIGQLWAHHTGNDESRGYGTKTRDWQLDIVMHMTPVRRPDTDVSFALEFHKARERTPDNRSEFQSITIALIDDEWTSGEHTPRTAGKNTKSLGLLREAISEAVLSAGRDHRPGGDGPLCKATTIDQARAIHARRYKHDGIGDRGAAERQAWRRAFRTASQNQLIGTEELNGIQLLWLAKEPRRDM